MPNIRSEGIFADTRSGGGLFRGFYDASATAGGTSVRRHGAPIDMVSHRDIAYWMHDFINNDDILNWEVNNVTSGTAVIAPSSPNGYLTLDVTTANQGLESVQFDDNTVDNAAAFITAAANRVIIYECRASLTVIDNCDWFIGIAEIDAAFMGSDGTLGAPGSDCHCGFHHLLSDSTSGVPYMSSNAAGGTTQQALLGAGVDYAGNTLSSPTVAINTKVSFGFRIEETDRIEFYINGQLVGVRTSTAAYDTAMSPVFCLIANGAACNMLVDYVMVAQTRSA